MNIVPRTILTALALAAVPATPAVACSVLGSYRAPTNLELVQRADLIVIGTVDRAVKGQDNGLGEIVVRPTKLLKGARLPKDVRLRGFLSDGQMPATKSDPHELNQPNPDAMAGSCTRYVFDKGMKLVVFLEKRDGKLQLAGYPFARVVEDVPSDNALWVKAVQTYVDVARLPERQRASALRTKREHLSHRPNDRDSKLLVQDIDRQLAPQPS